MSQFVDEKQMNIAPRTQWFHARPAAVAALGLLFGLLIGDGFSLPRALIAALVLLACALAARLTHGAIPRSDGSIVYPAPAPEKGV